MKPNQNQNSDYDLCERDDSVGLSRSLNFVKSGHFWPRKVGPWECLHVCIHVSVFVWCAIIYWTRNKNGMLLTSSPQKTAYPSQPIHRFSHPHPGRLTHHKTTRRTKKPHARTSSKGYQREQMRVER